MLQEGWRSPWGADADHIKSRADIDVFVATGYKFFTFDPGDHVDDAAEADSAERLRAKTLALPWEALRSSPQALYSDYLEQSFDIEGRSLTFDESSLLRAAVKYGHSIAHAAGLYAYLAGKIGSQPFEVEISVDETATPTTIHEHFFFARELQRLSVEWVSLAPRFVGLLAKGVDYIGDLEAFAADVQAQAAVARALGPYKLSLHSGSDKFSVYAPAYQATHGYLHVKTAGTSYLEALRVLATVEPGFFRQVLELARARFIEDKKSYILYVQPEKVPPAAALTDEELPGLLEEVNARQVLHVTYGSVLERHGETLKSVLFTHEGAYYARLSAHFERHFDAFHSSPGA